MKYGKTGETHQDCCRESGKRCSCQNYIFHQKAKTAAKTTTRKTCKTSVCVEMNGLSVAVADIQSAVKAAVKAQGLEASELKIYVNANEQAAYYTVDGQGGESYKVDLKAL